MSQRRIERRHGLASVAPVTLSVILAILVSFAVAGCGGGSDQASSGSGGNTDKLEGAREEAEESRSDAKEANAEKYAPKEWAAAVKKMEKAEDKYDEGDTKSKYFTGAKNAFRKAKRMAAKGQAKYEQAETEKKNFLAVQTKAKEAKIDENYPDDWASAQGKFAEAEKYLNEDGNFARAKSRYRLAKTFLEDKLATMEDDKKKMARALDAKKSMEEYRKKAMDSGADKNSIGNFEQGRKSEKEANDFYTDGRFEQALWSYNGAKDWYVAAIDEAADKKAEAEWQKSRDDVAKRGADESVEAPDLDDIDVPDLDDDAEDDGVDTDIASNLDKLFHTECEFRGDVIELSYPFGVDFRKDCYALGVKTEGKGRTLIFEGREGVGIFSGDKPDEEELDEVDPEDIISYTFAGNTGGAVLAAAKFKDGVQIEFDLRYQLVLAKSYMRFMLNSNKACTSYLGSEWGCWVLIAESKRAMKRDRHKDPLYKKAPQMWVDRKRAYHYKLIYRKDSEEDKGTFAVYMDDEEMFRIRSDKHRDGFPGFMWRNVKFVVQNLKIKGRLDQEWAIERLKEVADEPPEVEKEDLDF